MSEEDLKVIIAKYQQKAFELFNQNIVFESQLEQLKKTVSDLTMENEKLKKAKKSPRATEDFQ